MLNPERFFEALDERGELIGFYYFEPEPPDLDYGLGLRPDLTGQGLGPYFFNVGLAFARERFRPRQVFLHVAAFNERARLVYERAGFRIVSSHVRTFEDFGEVAFLTMTEAEQDHGTSPAGAVGAAGAAATGATGASSPNPRSVKYIRVSAMAKNGPTIAFAIAPPIQ